MYLKYPYYFVFVFILFTSCGKRIVQSDVSKFKYENTGIQSLSLKNHVAEGGLAKLQNGKVIVFYRTDSTFSHVSNSGAIFGKFFKKKTNTWSQEFEVYNSPYDDRNLVVGTLNNGEIIIVFRRYDDDNLMTIDTGFIKSKDGKNWSNYKTLSGTTNISNQPFGVINLNQKKESFLLAFDNGIIKKISSTDNFNDKIKTNTIINDSLKTLQEPFELQLNNSKSIILCRNGNGQKGEPSFYQYSSLNGMDYNYDGATNIFNDFDYSVRCPVSMSYDSKNDIMEVIGNTRYLYNTDKNKNNQLKIYRQSGQSIFKKPSNYVLATTIERPMSNAHWFYGYPKSISLNENEKLYIISDAKIYDVIKQGSHLKNEDANLYFFKIRKIPKQL